MDDVVETLKSFNAKIARLERSGFAERFENEVPEVMAKFESPIDFQNHGDGNFTLGGKIESWVPDYTEAAYSPTRCCPPRATPSHWKSMF
jgi:hypothetical protein